MEKYKVIELKGIVCFPDVPASCEIGQKESKNAMIDAYNKNEPVVMVTTLNNAIGNDYLKSVNSIGTLCKILQLKINKSKNTIQVVLEGKKRVFLQSVDESSEFRTVEAVDVMVEPEDDNIIKMLLASTKEKLFEYFAKSNEVDQRIINILKDTYDADLFINSATVLVVKEEEKQLKLLNEFKIQKRLELLSIYILEQMQILSIEEDIAKLMRNSMDKNQKEYYLREKMKAISTELGEDEEEYEEFENAIKNGKMPKEVQEKALKELNRLKRTPQQAPDNSILRNYLSELVELPWGIYTKDNEDLNSAREILDSQHSGLEKVKERIIENLAVMQLTKQVSGQIICFVGPPGVGKTSIAKSIAMALHRNFVKMSVGGVKDESEIRGHRKTYVGAMVGRIIYNIKQAKSMNPVFLIDEIDKMSSDYKGDPTSAMLEVLDPQQNNVFRDNFLEVPFDLSKVLFIATANNIQDIPAPLLDRMEVIELSSYTLNEKFRIAREHLLPKELVANGLKENQLVISDETLKNVIEEYTCEAGVRSLQRTIATICRKVAVKVVASNSKDLIVEVNNNNLKEFLGAHKAIKDEKRPNPEVGVVSGMSYSTVGGGVLSIEVNTVAGDGKIILTGRLGDVMKESAQAALSAITSLSGELGLDVGLFKKTDIHIHVPEGAIKKDGPSAGLAIATAIYSAVSGKRVDNNLAMTGEITIRGNALAIGGLKEKLFACVRAGIQNVIVPMQNKDDVEDLPKEITDNLNITYVSHIKQVLQKAIID